MARVSRAPLVVVLWLLAACCPQATIHAMRPSRSTALADEHRSGSLASGQEQGPRPIAVGRSMLPSGRAIADLSTRECERLLKGASVRFDALPHGETPSITDPLALHSKLLNVEFGPANGMAKNGIVDCKLAVALLAWAPILHDAGVVRVEHYSTFRPGARVRKTGKTSGHAHALAIDAARFYMRDGRVIGVLEDWDEREPGGAPCPVRRSESDKGRVLRQVVCRAIERDLFQVVITPHHDRDHQNHVHLELVPKSDWSYIH
ncbi:MAG: Extensin-like protein [Myxococcaceae bacterium]|nr:Extensin-like protein [Myxococcaceae bacterium]